MYPIAAKRRRASLSTSPLLRVKQASLLLNGQEPTIPTHLRIWGLNISMQARQEGMDYGKWNGIARQISARMGLTTPMSAAQVKGQIGAYVTSVHHRRHIRPPLKHQEAINKILEGIQTPRQQGLRAFPNSYAYHSKRKHGAMQEMNEHTYDQHNGEDDVDDEDANNGDDSDVSNEGEYDWEQDAELLAEFGDYSDNDVLSKDSQSSMSPCTNKVAQDKCCLTTSTECVIIDDDDDPIPAIYKDVTEDSWEKMVQKDFEDPVINEYIQQQQARLKVFEKAPTKQRQLQGKENIPPQNRPTKSKTYSSQLNVPPTGLNGRSPVITEQMTSEMVFAALRQEYNQDFPFIIEQKVDGEAFYTLTREDMQNFGVVFGDCVKITKLQNLRQEPNLVFGPAAKACVSSAKRLADDVILQKARERQEARQTTLDARANRRKTDVESIVRAKVSKNGKITYYTKRFDGKIVVHDADYMDAAYSRLKAAFDEKHPEQVRVPQQPATCPQPLPTTTSASSTSHGVTTTSTSTSTTYSQPPNFSSSSTLPTLAPLHHNTAPPPRQLTFHNVSFI